MNLFFSNSALKFDFSAPKSHSLTGLFDLFGILQLKTFFCKKMASKTKEKSDFGHFFCFILVIFVFRQKNDLYRKFEKGEPSKMVFKMLKSHYFRSCEVFLAFQRIQIRFTIVNLRKKLISEAKSRLKD